MPSCDTPSHDPDSNPDPIRDIRWSESPSDPSCLVVTIDLAGHVAACCINVDTAFVEAHGSGHTVRASFTLHESRPAHHLEATLRLPSAGAYTYRIVGNILGRSLTREGTIQV